MKNEELWTAGRFFIRLDKMLEEKQWNLNQLTTKIGASSSLLYELRRKKMLPRFGTICQICDALNVSLFEFFVAEEEAQDKILYLIRLYKFLPKNEQNLILELVRALSKKYVF